VIRDDLDVVEGQRVLVGVAEGLKGPDAVSVQVPETIMFKRIGNLYSVS
jgi:hypothetical protein